MDLQDGKRMLGDIKSKLGFGSKDKADEYDEYYADEYDDYADDYADGYDDGYADDAYDGYDASSSRSSRYDSHASSASRDSRSAVSSRAEVRSPRLVSIEDVRASTRAGNVDRDSSSRYSSGSSFSSGSSSYRGNRTMVDSSLPPQMTPEGTAAQAAAASGRRVSEGLDSLFSPTTGETSYARADSVAPSHSPSASPVFSRSAYDPFDSYSGASSASYSATRSVVVLKPMSYAEVERVSKSLKAGDAVVLCLGSAPDSLAKRVLDFSFGVASALDASVECIADKVFAVTRGKDLTETERADLRGQGVL